MIALLTFALLPVTLVVRKERSRVADTYLVTFDIDGDSCATYVIASDPDSAFDEAMKIHPRPDAQPRVAQIIALT